MDASDDLLICRCQEVTLGAIREAIARGARDMGELKLRTEAMMGLCQGATCRAEIARILARETGQEVAALLVRSARPPERPLPLAALAQEEES
jgi:NAD(P)H-nitrite reductase large subunit